MHNMSLAMHVVKLLLTHCLEESPKCDFGHTPRGAFENFRRSWSFNSIAHPDTLMIFCFVLPPLPKMKAASSSVISMVSVSNFSPAVPRAAMVSAAMRRSADARPRDRATPVRRSSGAAWGSQKGCVAERPPLISADGARSRLRVVKWRPSGARAAHRRRVETVEHV